MTPTPVAVRRGPVVWRRLPDEVLVRVPGGGTLALAGTGAELWDLVSSPRTVAVLSAALAARHRADPATVAADVDTTVADLVDRRVLVAADPNDAVAFDPDGPGAATAGSRDRAAVDTPGATRTVTVDEVLDALVVWGHRPLAPVTLDPGDVDRLVEAARADRLGGILAAAVDAGFVELPPAAARTVRSAHRDALSAVLGLDELLVAVVDALDAVGIEHRLLKGAALAHLAHRRPADRLWGDLDVLVPAPDLDRAVDALAGLGVTRRLPPLRAGYDRRFAKAVTLADPEGREVDLHRTPAVGPYGLVADPAVWFAAPTSSVDLGPRWVTTLDATGHLVAAAVHLALGDVTPRRGHRRDLLGLLGHRSLDPDAARSLAAAAGLTVPFALGLAAVADLLDAEAGWLGGEPARGPTVGGRALVDWARGVEPTPRDRRLLAAYRSRSGRFGRQVRASLSVLGRRDRLAFVGAIVWPDRANLAARGLDRRRHLRRLLRGR